MVNFHRHQLPEQAICKMEVRAIVDSSALMLSIDQAIADQLSLVKLGERTAELADGSQLKVPVVGPVYVQFKNWESMCNAMVLPGRSECLLGAIPMEEMDVLIDPSR
jgi:hypothetical protein